MSLRLMLDDDTGIPIPLDDCTKESWAVQFDRWRDREGLAGLQHRLASCLAVSVGGILDDDLKVPTEAQLRQASRIAREMGIALPSKALRFRGAMAEFISANEESWMQCWKNLC